MCWALQLAFWSMATGWPLPVYSPSPTSQPSTSQPSEPPLKSAIANPPNPAPISPAAAPGLITAQMQRRIVKQFDFDEKRFGNDDRAPMNWTRVLGDGYPRFLEATFDESSGHDAPPSYHFKLAGGSLATRYIARDIDVLPGSLYQIEAFIRPAGIRYAEARITAYFLDHAMRKIEASERACKPVRGIEDDEPWRRVVLNLPTGFDQARWIGLTCELRQAPRRDGDRLDPRPINHDDMEAEAWFDDITVLRLPEATLGLSTPGVELTGNVFVFDEPIDVRCCVRDVDGVGLASELQILSGNGDRISQRFAVPTVQRCDDAPAIRLENLDAGRYTARLVVSAEDRVLLSVERPFIRLGESRSRLQGAAPESAGSTTPIGLILSPNSLDDLQLARRLAHCLEPGMVKLPLWRTAMDDRRIVFGDSAFNRFLDDLANHHALPVAILEGPPKSLMLQFEPGRDGLLDILAAPPARWRAYLALPLAQLGARIRYWQLGPDVPAEKQATAPTANAATAFSNVLAELKPLVNDPVVIIPTGAAPCTQPDTSSAGGAKPGAATGGASIAPSASITSQRLADELGRNPTAHAMPRWGVVEPLDATRFDRSARLAEFSRRIVTQLASGMDNVFIREPWRVEADQINPFDELAIAHTLADSLRGLGHPTPVWIEDGVTGWLFTSPDRERGVLIAWTDGDAGMPREVSIDAGPAVRRVDPWGNRSDQPAGRLTIDAAPAIFEGIETWRVAAQAAFALNDTAFMPALKPQPRKLTLTNPRNTRVRGRLRLLPPIGLGVEPRQTHVDIQPGQSIQIPVAFQVPTNFPAGTHVMSADLLMDGTTDHLALRTPVRVRVTGLDVQVTAAQSDGRTRILQRITNRTDHSLALRCTLVAPGHPRESRSIPDLPPGQSVTRTYDLAASPQTAPATARVSVTEINGTLIHNDVVPLP